MTAPAAVTGQSNTEDTRVSSPDDGTSRKRMRVSRACDACRRRKERCNGAQPACQRCIAVGRPCSYNPYRKRGLRTGYVKGTEILLGLLIHSYGGAEDLVLSVLGAKDDGQTAPLHDHTAVSAASSSLLATWRNSAALEHLQKTLIVTEPEEDEESYLEDLDDKLTTAFNTLCPRNDVVEDTLPTPTNLLTNLSAPLPSAILPAAYPPTPQASLPAAPCGESLGALERPRLPLNWPLLIDVYLSYTHSWLPIIEKHTLLRSASLLADNADNIGTADAHHLQPGEVTSLWASLAFSLCQIEAVEVSGAVIFPTYHVGEFTLMQLHAFAKSLAGQDPPSYDHGHIHAFLVLSLIDIIQGSWTKAWFWVGRAVNVATSLEIVPPRDKKAATRILDDTDKRLFHGCFILDTLLASMLGYRPYLNTTDSLRVGSVTTNGPEEWEPWRLIFEPAFGVPTGLNLGGPARVLSTFNRLSHLAGLLNDLNNLAPDAASTPRLEKMLRELVRRHDLPQTPKGNQGSKSQQAVEPPHTMHLKLVTAVTYVRIKTEICRSTTCWPESFSDNVPSVIADALEFLKSTPKQSPLFNVAWSPPILPISLHLLSQIGASSPESALRADWISTYRSTGFRHNPDPGGEIHGRESHVRDRPPLPESLRVPQRGESLSQGMRNRNNYSSDLCSKSSPEILGMSPSMPSAIDPVVDIGEGSHVDDTAGGNGLFDQLALLDTADCPDFSTEFMERIGFARNGSFMDIDNLFS